MIAKPSIAPLLPDDADVAARSQALAGELVADLAANPGRSRGRRIGIWRTLLALVAVCLTGVGVATAAGVFSAEDMQVSAGIGCYSEASLRPESIAILGPRQDPVASCAELWRNGEIDNRPRPVAPQLVACTAEDQPVRVIPGRGVASCRRLGLVELPVDYPAKSGAVTRLREALSAVGWYVPGQPGTGTCTAPAQALADAERDLDIAGFGDVDISARGDRQCAGHFIVEDDGLALVTITPDQFRQRRLELLGDR